MTVAPPPPPPKCWIGRQSIWESNEFLGVVAGMDGAWKRGKRPRWRYKRRLLFAKMTYRNECPARPEPSPNRDVKKERQSSENAHGIGRVWNGFKYPSVDSKTETTCGNWNRVLSGRLKVRATNWSTSSEAWIWTISDCSLLLMTTNPADEQTAHSSMSSRSVGCNWQPLRAVDDEGSSIWTAELQQSTVWVCCSDWTLSLSTATLSVDIQLIGDPVVAAAVGFFIRQRWQPSPELDRLTGLTGSEEITGGVSVGGCGSGGRRGVGGTLPFSDGLKT